MELPGWKRYCLIIAIIFTGLSCGWSFSSVSSSSPVDIPVDIKFNNNGQVWQELFNDYDGFKLKYPADWQQDIIPGVATVLTKPGYVKLTVLSQPLKGISPEEYIYYSNRSLYKGWGTIKLGYHDRTELKGYSTWQFDWTRRRLFPGDLNCYREYHVLVDKRVYTFMMKSNSQNFSAAAEDLNRILETFEPYQPRMAPVFPEVLPAPRKVEIDGREQSLVIPEDKTLWGILNPHKLGRMDYFNNLKLLEEELDFKFQFLITYASFDTWFNKEELRRIYNDNRILMVALQPWWYGERDDTTLIDLIQGQYDYVFRQYARQFKSLGGPVFVRFGNEMNGDWCTWSAWYYGKDTDIYKMAAERVSRLFRAEGADNVLFVFNPHDRSYPNFKWNNYLLYYPGNEYVDWIGLTGYNNGTSYPGDVWRDFHTVYAGLYREYMHYFGNMPFMITEFACNEAGGDKAAWIKECFQSLAVHYPNIKIAVWFNQVDGKWQYNLDSSLQSLKAFKEGLKLPCYRFQAVLSNLSNLSN